jgi:orotidine-5'-phosphate decarboxylase
MKHSPIILALDFADPQAALAIIHQLAPRHCRLKIGKELFTRSGPALIEKLVKQGFEVFLDLKYHDIPNTVARACSAVAELGVWMINVHASGGRQMLLAAREALDKFKSPPLLIAVTILTSLEGKDLYTIGLHGTLEENVLRLARLAKGCYADGVVCSPHEITLIRNALGDEFILVTPGLRLTEDSHDDQKRVMTPSQAWQLGANYLVIGRPIIKALNPLQALLNIEKSLSQKPS